MILVLCLAVQSAAAVATRLEDPTDLAFVRDVLKTAAEAPLDPTLDENALRIVGLPNVSDLEILTFQVKDGLPHLLVKTICPEIFRKKGRTFARLGTVHRQPRQRRAAAWLGPC